MIEETPEANHNYIEQAIDLRFSFQIPEYGAELVELHHALVEIQSILSKMEKILSDSLRAKASLDRRQAHLKMVWQEAFDRALQKRNTGFDSDFVTGKEKAAKANLAAFNEARALLNVENSQSYANETVDIVRLHYYGLDKLRQDIRKRLDLAQTEYISA